ncbi:MAG: hypothetical protein IIW54_04670, partial [Lachnospiraceae bacterium]|nr:hypothetical protein [Lachnospiraceae bacterium]
EATVVPEELQFYAPVVTRSEVEVPQIVSKQVVSTTNIIKENGAGIATNLKVLAKTKSNPMPVACGCIGIAAAVSIFFVMRRRKNK